MMRTAIAVVLAMTLMACGGDPESSTSNTPDSIIEDTAPSTGPQDRLSTDAIAYAALAERVGSDWLELFREVESANTLNARHVSELEQHQNEVDELMRLARAQHVDFGFRMSDGIDALLPHLMQHRHFARVLRADALRLVAAGDGVAAADRLAALVSAARQVASDQLTLSSLVGLANLAVAMETTNELLDGDRLSPEAAASLADAFRQVDEDNPIGARQAALNDIDVIVYSLRNNAVHPEGLGTKLAQFSDAQRFAGADELDRMRLAVADAWDQRDAAAVLESIEQRIESPAAIAVMPAYSAFRRQVTRSSRDLRNVLRRLDRAAGE